MRGKLRSSSLVAVGIMALATVLSPPATATARAPHVDWRQFHGSPTHRGLNPFERRLGAANVSSLSLAWIGNGATVGPDLVFRSSPTVVDGFVYFGTEQGQLLAFPETCPPIGCVPAWRKRLGQSIYNTPAVARGVLYVGTASPLGKLYAFDVTACGSGSCSPLWTGHVAVGDSSPSVSNGTVYVGSQSEDLYAFSAGGCGQSECQPLWIGDTGGYVLGSPTVADGLVFVGASDGKLYAFDAAGCGAATCSPVWTATLSAPVYSVTPAVANGVVYVASYAAAPNGYLYAFAASGCGHPVCQPLWRGTGGHYLDSSPAVAYGNVYIGSGDGTLRVYPAAGCGEASCGATWIGMAPGPVATMEGPPTVANGVVYVGENNNRVYAFPARGCGRTVCSRLWEFMTQDPLVNSAPTVVNSTVYVSGTNFGSVPELYVFTLS